MKRCALIQYNPHLSQFLLPELGSFDVKNCLEGIKGALKLRKITLVSHTPPNEKLSYSVSMVYVLILSYLYLFVLYLCGMRAILQDIK